MGDKFWIRDMIGRPCKVLQLPDGFPIINNVRGQDPYWSIKRYRMNVLFMLKATYDHPDDYFIFYFWIKDAPIPYAHYEYQRGMLAYYCLYMFNIHRPDMYCFEISENKIIITDKPYLVKFSASSIRDLEQETNYEITDDLNRLV